MARVCSEEEKKNQISFYQQQQKIEKISFDSKSLTSKTPNAFKKLATVES